MKKSHFIKQSIQVSLHLLFVICFISCESNKEIQVQDSSIESVNISQKTKDYWYSGKAEITSYELIQQRYGEARKGKAVLVFVTEDFDDEQLVKTNSKDQTDFSVLKLNAMKNFTTGIYPYHIMQSTFLPMEKNQAAVKIASSIQEWCGQSYMQLEQRKQQEIQINSYFKQVGNYKTKLQNYPTENALWTQLRLFPLEVNLEVDKMIPSFEYLRLNNIEVDAYQVKISQVKEKGQLTTHLNYPTLKRRVEITQDIGEPYGIIGWKEIIKKDDSSYVTSAKKIEQIQIDYWNKNSNQFSYLRDSLKL
jgi:hypothetical protein